MLQAKLTLMIVTTTFNARTPGRLSESGPVAAARSRGSTDLCSTWALSGSPAASWPGARTTSATVTSTSPVGLAGRPGPWHTVRSALRAMLGQFSGAHWAGSGLRPGRGPPPPGRDSRGGAHARRTGSLAGWRPVIMQTLASLLSL